MSEIQLVKYDTARKALAEAHSVDEVKDVRDKAEAMRAYAKQANDIEFVNWAAEIKLRAERKLGELLKETERAKGGRPPEQKPLTSCQEFPTLPELGVSYKQSSRWQRIASIPEEKFERHIAEVKAKNEELTTASAYKLTKELERDKRIEAEKIARSEAIADIEIRHGDFKEVLQDIHDIDAIITDPPYPYEFINCFSELGKYASEHLKEDGFCAVYSGQYHLPEVIKRLSEYLTYVWTFCLYHASQKQIVNGVNTMCGWKPVIIFSRGNKKFRYSVYDVLISEQREKANHEWQQSGSGVKPLIEALTLPGELVVDPFAGSGTFLKVAKDLGRRAIGAEISD